MARNKWDNLYQAFLIVGGTHEQRFNFMMQAYDGVVNRGGIDGSISFVYTDYLFDVNKIQCAIYQSGAILDRITSIAKWLDTNRLNIAMVCDSPLEMDSVNVIKNEPFGGIDLWRECVGMQPKISNYGFVISIDDETKIKDIDGSYIDEDRVLKMKNSPDTLAELIIAIGRDQGAV